MTAAELMAKLQKDPAWVEAREKEEQERQERLRLLEKESEAFAKECAEAGYTLKTPWDLRKNERYPLLVPILFKHLSNRSYSARFREGAAYALETPDASVVFDGLLELFDLEEVVPTGGVRWAVACALAVAAKKEDDFNRLEKLILDPSKGSDRSAFLKAVKRMPKAQREAILVFARADPQLKINLKVNRLR